MVNPQVYASMRRSVAINPITTTQKTKPLQPFKGYSSIYPNKNPLGNARGLRGR